MWWIYLRLMYIKYASYEYTSVYRTGLMITSFWSWSKELLSTRYRYVMRSHMGLTLPGEYHMDRVSLVCLLNVLASYDFETVVDSGMIIHVPWCITTISLAISIKDTISYVMKSWSRTRRVVKGFAHLYLLEKMFLGLLMNGNWWSVWPYREWINKELLIHSTNQ